MPKKKLRLNGHKPKKRAYVVSLSFEVEKPDKKLLPKKKEGILVRKEPVYKKWFTPERFKSLLEKGYVVAK